MLIFCLVYWSLFKRHRVDVGENMMMKCIYCLLWFQSKSLSMRNLPILTRSKAHMPPRIYVYRCDYMYGWIITIHQPWPLLNYLLHPYTVNENHDHSDIYYLKNHTELNLWLPYHVYIDINYIWKNMKIKLPFEKKWICVSCSSRCSETPHFPPCFCLAAFKKKCFVCSGYLPSWWLSVVVGTRISLK